MKFEFKLANQENIIKNGSDILVKRGLLQGGLVQQVIDSDVLKFCDPYVPFDTGMLKDSGISSTVIGSGTVIYDTPYARRQYYKNRGTGMRGRLWFERMKADHKEDILRDAAKAAGGKI